MGVIKITKIELSPLTLQESKVVVLSYRLTSEPDIPLSYTIATNSLIVPVGGILPEPYFIDGLDNGKSYTVKAQSDCGNYHFTKEFQTGYPCPAFVSGSLQGRVMQEVPQTKCADCGLVLNGIPSGQISSMSAGVLTSGVCGLTDYVIDWFLNDEEEPRFTSGSDAGLDDDVTVIHPFAGEPVQGGIWHPKVRFADIDGYKYSGEIMEGARWSPDLLTCLPDVVVQNFSCANGGTVNNPLIGSGTPYSHGVTYTNVVNSPTLATRSIRFDLDNTNRYFAWSFNGFSVYDTLKITHVSPLNETSDVVEWWRVGSDSPIHTYQNTPYTTTPNGSQQQWMYKILSLAGFAYAVGDHLIIEVTPNPVTSNTNWGFYCKCLSEINCILWDTTQRQINAGSFSMAWDAVECRYVVSYTRPAWGGDISASILYKYHFKTVFSYGLGGVLTPVYDMAYNTIQLEMRKKTTAVGINIDTYYLCRQLAGSSTVAKSGSVVTFTYTNVTDYNYYKNKFNTMLAHAYMTSYSADDTVVNHYKFFIIYIRTGAATCGDTQAVKAYYTHYSNQPVFNDGAKTITVTLASKVNNYIPSGVCDKTSEAINSFIGQVNVAAADVETYSITSLIGADTGFTGISIQQTVLNELDKTFRVSTVFPVVDSNVCDLATKQWTHRNAPFNEWEFSYINDRVVITNEADPINNFKVYRQMDANGEASADIKVYEISGGVVVP